MKRNILIVALFTFFVLSSAQVHAALNPNDDVSLIPSKDTSSLINSPSFSPSEDKAASGIDVIPSDDKPKGDLAAQKNEIAVCNKAKRLKSPNIPVINFEAQIVYPGNQNEVKVKSLSVICESASGKTKAQASVEILKTSSTLIQLIRNKITGPANIIEKETTQCKVSDKIVSFILNDARTELSVVCGTPKENSKDYLAQYASNYSPVNNAGLNNTNSDNFDLGQTADEAAAAGDMSQPSSQGAPYGGQGLQQYNPYDYQYADGLASEEGGLSTDELLYNEDEYRESGYGGEIVDWRGETGTEEGKAGSGGFYNPVLGDDIEGFFGDDDLVAYNDSFYYDLPQDNSEGYINALLSGNGEGAGALDYAVWEAEEKATRDGWTPLDVSYEEYQEYYIGATLTRSQWDNWYKRLVNPVDFSYNPGLDSPSDSQSTGGFFSRGWAWLVSWFEETIPTDQYYEI